MKKSLIALMFLTSVAISMPSFAAEPSLHQVYQAAEAGKLNEAQQLMHEVLLAHPNSGKAHYVEAELLAKQGQLKQAGNELATAERLSPGLPFATPQSVSSLKNIISHHSASPVAQVQQAPISNQSVADAPTSSLPWGMIFGGLGLIAFIVWISKFMASRNPPGGSLATAGQPGSGGYRPSTYPSSAYGGAPQGYAAPGVGPVGGGSGIGSQVLGGLATGAAVGAGVVAGEALMHHFMDGRSSTPSHSQGFASNDAIPDLPSTPLDDMGGNDFGIADNSSWDDSSSSGDSDWN
jgi:hypothetical protein